MFHPSIKIKIFFKKKKKKNSNGFVFSVAIVVVAKQNIDKHNRVKIPFNKKQTFFAPTHTHR
jgi:hypothetical protein